MSCSTPPKERGPSPRVWGLRGTGARWAMLGRSIPTRVGTTLWCGTTKAGSPVHPHACGDYVPAHHHVQPHRGPSPRVWGLRGGTPLSLAHPRSIPTRVGTTAASPGPLPGGAVHPHACGDYALVGLPLGNAYGPSPRVWGLRGSGGGRRGLHRSIPTRVGTTSAAGLLWLPAAVHPHACGDYGSRSAGCSGRTVHPHACGDYARAEGSYWGPTGPSPRVWGLRLPQHV